MHERIVATSCRQGFTIVLRCWKVKPEGGVRRQFPERSASVRSSRGSAQPSFGDPIDIKVKGYRLSLRKEEARDVHTECALDLEKMSIFNTYI